MRTPFLKIQPALVSLCLLGIGWPHARADDEPARNFLVRGRIVDQNDNPVVGADVKTMNHGVDNPVFSTKSRSNGAFAMKVPSHGHYGPALLVTNPSGTLASYVSQFSYSTDERKPFDVVLSPWQTTQVRVIDKDKNAVPGATVVLQADYMELVRATTNASGNAALKFPSDAKVDWINALKDDVGYDYYENYDAFPTSDRLQVPDQVTLQLMGALNIKVAVTDDLKQPVPGATVSPWTIQLPGKLSYANVGGTLLARSDDKGIAHLKWMPIDMRSCNILVNAKGFHSAKSPRYEQGGSTELVADVFRNGTVTGKVTFPDGSPAPGIRIQGEGRGDTNHYFRGYTTTKSDGTYEIEVYPNQNLILAVTEKNHAAESATGLLLQPGKKAKADFVLLDGTLIRGTLTVGTEKSPLAGETATLVQKDGNVSLVRWSKADPDGDYFFRVGPGDYSLSLPGQGSQQIAIMDEDEIVRSAHIPRKPRATLTGTIVDVNDKPVADVQIHGESVGAQGHAGFKTTSAADGTYKTERWTDEMVVFAVNQKRMLAAMEEITPDDSSTNLKMQPAATVQGTVLNKNGKPADNVRVQLSLKKPDSGSAHYFVYTDKDGKFAFPCPVGARCTGYIHNGKSSVDLGHLETKALKKYEFDAVTIKIDSATAEAE